MPRMSALASPVYSPGENTLAKLFHPAAILVGPPVNPPRALPRYRYKEPAGVTPRMSALPSPVKSPGENTLTKLFHPAAILVGLPVNPPRPLPRYRYKEPAGGMASRSDFRSPGKSPGENTPGENTLGVAVFVAVFAGACMNPRVLPPYCPLSVEPVSV